MQPKLIITLALIPCFAIAQNTLRVSSVAWQNLADSERVLIQNRYIVETLPSESFGIILDNQSADRSTLGSIAGSGLGQAVASAAYIDKAIGSGDYSAKTHLGVALLGGLLGSVLDNKPQSQYQFRYAIRLGNGEVIYQDTFSKDPFRHPIGLCVTIPGLLVLPEQHICNQTAESLRSAHVQPTTIRHAAADQAFSSNALHQDKNNLISCHFGALAPVQTTIEKCKLINGVAK